MPCTGTHIEGSRFFSDKFWQVPGSFPPLIVRPIMFAIRPDKFVSGAKIAPRHLAPNCKSFSLMARKMTVLQSQFPYHVSARCINREWFDLPMDIVWEVMCEQLYFIHHAFRVDILAFVLMNNHFHLILRTPLANLPIAMAWFMRETSRTLTRLSGRVNQAYGGRYFRSVLGTNLYYQHAYKYVYANPLKANLCESAIDYPYSTLCGKLGVRKILIPVVEDLTLFSDVEGTLAWIDSKPSEENWQSVRKALRKRDFMIEKVRGSAHPLENERL